MEAERLTASTDAGPTEGGVAPSEWKRVRRRGTVAFHPMGGSEPFVSWLEASAPSTNFDVILDWSAATYPADAYILAAIFAFGLGASGKVYVGQWQLSPIGGIIWGGGPTGITAPPAPAWARATQSGGIGGLQFILQAGGISALGWGLELSCIAFTVGDGVNNFLGVGIAHGREYSNE